MKCEIGANRSLKRGMMAFGAAALALTCLGSGDARAGATAKQRPANTLATVSFSDIKGANHSGEAIESHKASVFLFLSSQCPVSNVYTPRFIDLASKYGKQDVQVFGIYSDRQESLADVTKHASERGLTFPVVKDAKNVLADRLGASMTPEAILVDAKGHVRYRGRVDDNSVATRVTSHDLVDALNAVLAGNAVAHPEMLGIGCAIRRTAPVAVAHSSAPTYSGAVAAILRSKCESCHRAGEVAPFSLQTYQQASAWAADIKKYTQNQQMPPWKPSEGYGAFRDVQAHVLSDQQRTTLAKWVDAGAPLGDAKQTPPPAKFTQGWKLGEPDAILMPDKPYHVAASGEDVYRNFIVKTNFPEDRYISAVEIRVGNSAVVHHVINYVDAMHQADKLEGKDNDGQPGFTGTGPGFLPSGFLSGWAPGNDPYFQPDGVAWKLPKGASIVMQVHYHKDGKPETDLTKVGLHFARTTVDKEVAATFAINFLLHIPAGEPNYETRATTTVEEDSHLLAVTPHMHLLGRNMKVWATLPDGTEKPLVWIKDWDFNWQMTYFLQEPIALPKGSKLHLIADYDNSPRNKRNPNIASPRDVTWGEQTTDEMCIAFFTVTKDSEHLAAKPVALPLRSASARP